MSTHCELVRELRTLRKGRGVFSGRISERIGPHLRTMCGVTSHDGPVTVRKKIVARLIELAEQLPEDMRLASVAAFALSNEIRLPLYQDRIHWAAIRIDRGPRTVRRRVDEAIDQLAELITTTPRTPSGIWHTAELHVAIALDRPQPEVLERHRIVADEDGLHELEFTSPLAAERRHIEVDVLYGGTLPDDSLGLTLPGPLSKGESHDFAVRFRLSSPQALRSYVVRVPKRAYDLFDLRVRFGRDWAPPHVWILREVHQNAVANPPHREHRHPVDRAGEIHQRFSRLLPGLAYGVRWELDQGPIPNGSRFGL
ncbi:hypothetical protein [Kibdelosporangium phytohabitans]|nr:hypothetical protein [Kibdelosporangium phytohabitans]MBE1465703.1 hypothetical protein [Kibdelosporangium phytohabitans]